VNATIQSKNTKWEWLQLGKGLYYSKLWDRIRIQGMGWAKVRLQVQMGGGSEKSSFWKSIFE
jgi:hypothetical protein